MPTQMTQLDYDDDGSDQGNCEEHVKIGESEYNLVGIRYYKGVAYPGEFVNLVREPHNPYDSNAIRVDNLRNEKVGHVKATQASMLARLMDDAALNHLKLEASIPRRGNKFQLPLQVSFYGVSPTTEGSQEMALNLASTLQSALRGDYRFRVSSSFDPSYQGGSAVASPAAVPVPSVVHNKKLDWDAQAKELDEIFDKQCEMQTKNLTNIPMPTQFNSNLKLFDYQETGIRWLVHQEVYAKEVPFFERVNEGGRQMWLCKLTNSSQAEEPKIVRGGILADEMGLGKTIQTIGLILAAPPSGHEYKGEAKEAKIMPTRSRIEVEKAGVLKSILKAAGLKQSGKKADQVDRIMQGIEDETVTVEHFPELMTAVPKLQATTGGSGFCTLIVCPVSVISNWQQQISNHVQEGVLKVDVFQGPNRSLLLPYIKENRVDVLLVSYHTLASEFKSIYGNKKADGSEPVMKKTRKESIFDVCFHRIVLDEAHMIRSNKSSFFKAVTAIQADRKLGLTGTPFVNRADDIQSLLSFLQVEPLSNGDIFRRAISQQIKDGYDIGLTRLRTIVSHVALRRSKAIANIKLAHKEVTLRSVEFPDDGHKEVYDALFGTFRAAVSIILEDANGTGEMTKRYSSVLEVLLRMRQSCCSASLVPEERRIAVIDTWKNLKENKDGVKLSIEEAKSLLEKVNASFSQGDEMPECAVCFEEMNENECRILKTCQHLFCQACIRGVLDLGINRNCPLCRTPFQSSDLVQKSMAEKMSTKESSADAKVSGDNDVTCTPPKITALLDAIKEMRTDEKAVVFSQFTKFLDLIGTAFESAGMNFVRIDGSMSTKKRLEAITLFDSDDAESPTFILCSLHAAGVGINLTRGSVVFMMDSWWNEAVENQAMDRVHRIGQSRDVKVIRFVMKDSIEERMVTIQRGKSMQAKGAMQKLSKDEMKASRLSELKNLLMLDGKSESN